MHQHSVFANVVDVFGEDFEVVDRHGAGAVSLLTTRLVSPE